MATPILVARAQTPEWYKARQYGVSATTVAKAASGPAGFKAELEAALYPEEHQVTDNAYMKFGRDWEEWIINALPGGFQIAPNDWLVRSSEQAWYLATPDGNNPDWTTIAEVKTTGRDWEEKHKIPIQYRRQVQWQLAVTGAFQCVFGWLLRAEDADGNFVPAWTEPKWVVFQRDNEMIRQLDHVAKRFITEFNFHKEMEALHGTVQSR